MKSLKFSKMVASGNDFVVIAGARQVTGAANRRALISRICDRKYGIGADGLLILEKSPRADVRMRIFNPDGSEAEMCGNGARCVALFVGAKRTRKRPTLYDASASRFLRERPVSLDIETKAGIIKSEVRGKLVKIKLTAPEDVTLDIPLRIGRRTLRVNFINTGVPHTVIFVAGLENIDVQNLGNWVRYHRIFAPAGTNVNFVEAMDNRNIRIRTYERGVEDETLACGTGSVAAALITGCKLQSNGQDYINVHTQGKEALKVYFTKSGLKFSNVWLQGRAACLFNGEFLF
jgi:diaminopimelate epimerase